jgi:predicted TIM-barrel fold metal-dependent hydrolase
MTERLDPEDYDQLYPAQEAFRSPVPTRVISNGEFMPAPQGEAQKRVEARIASLADELGARQGLDRRGFLASASGMAAAFLAMNEVYGAVFDVSRAEAATPEMANERARALSPQFIFDCHTHFLRDDSTLQQFAEMRNGTGARGENPALAGRKQTLNDLHLDTYVREMYLDSDTKIALLSGAPSDIPDDWFLTNRMKAEARASVNAQAGSRRLMSHFVFTPGQPGWLDAIDRGIEELKPDGWKGYTIGDNTHKEISRWPWRMDDEKVTYKAYEKFAKSGIRNVAVHKGLFNPTEERRFPQLTQYAKVDDVGRAARDWPQLNFLIYHGGYRYTGAGQPDRALAQFEKTGKIDWVSDLCEVPAKYGVANVYADIGASFAALAVSHPAAAAAMVAMLIKGLGPDHVLWGTDSIWFGSPQWQIEAFRRLEVPEDQQRRYGFAPLGGPESAVKQAIFGGNGARLFGLNPAQASWEGDAFARQRRQRLAEGAPRTNLAYGYVRKDA